MHHCCIFVDFQYTFDLSQNLKSGSTGVSVLIRGNKLHVAWLGDSQAALVRDGEVIQLVDPHKPEREVCK